MEAKRHFLLVVSPLQGGHLAKTQFVFFLLIFTWVFLGNAFSLKSKRDYINIKKKKNQIFPRLMPK